jgi:hypothetical protein
MELTPGSEMSTHLIQTPGLYPKENTLHIQRNLESVPASSVWSHWYGNRPLTTESKHNSVWSVCPGYGSHGQYAHYAGSFRRYVIYIEK